MFLTKLEIPLHSRRAAALLQDGQRMHRMISGMFGQPRQAVNVLYRVNVVRGLIQVYLYSDRQPEQIPQEVRLAGQRDLTQWVSSMQAGELWRFDLLAQPAKKVYQAERDKNSRRRVLREPEERMQWLRRKAEQNGFSVLQAEELEQHTALARHDPDKGGVMHMGACRFEGVLRIEDAEKFRAALRTGIGPGKAYGMGMLLLKR